jgi:hypothetical protein
VSVCVRRGDGDGGGRGYAYTPSHWPARRVSPDVKKRREREDAVLRGIPLPHSPPILLYPSSLH